MGNLTSCSQSYKIVVLYRTTTVYFAPFKISWETIRDEILSLLGVF